MRPGAFRRGLPSFAGAFSRARSYLIKTVDQSRAGQWLVSVGLKKPKKEFNSTLFENRVVSRMAELLVDDDEADDWQELAERLSLEALDKGIHLPSAFGKMPSRWARDVVSALRPHVNYEILVARYDCYQEYLESEETAEGLFLWLLSPLHVSDY